MRWHYAVSFIRTGFREIALKVKRQRTRMALRHERRLLQKSEINLGREGTTQAANFPELRNEIVALKTLEQDQKDRATAATKHARPKCRHCEAGGGEKAAPPAAQSGEECCRRLRT